ncbi:BamA/TamA family outer membrane protein [Edwardsiella tarda]|uniref:BamA/TamA family outer membrane protein n=1 Tax=Edwardsiella tarda TaxID=636 RepID=UPI003F65E58D
MRYLLRGLTLLCTLSPLAGAAALLPTRAQVDSWLTQLGGDDRFDPDKGIDWGVLPGPFFNPELGLGLGAAVAGLYRPDATDTVSQNSSITLSGYISSTGAFGLGIRNYSFFANDQWRIFINGGISDTPTYYWGQGFRAGADDEGRQKYTAQSLRLQPEVLYRLASQTYLGVGWSLSMMHAADVKSTDRLAQIPHGRAVSSSGPSLSLQYDSRDFVPNPRRGMLASLRYTHYLPEMGSDTRFDNIIARFSTYHALDEWRVLAWEIDGEFTLGAVPWNMLPSLGSDQRMRGYYQGRYRDRNLISSQLEYRQKLSWRHGFVVWGGAGTMGPNVRELGSSRWLPTLGVGYRFAFKPGINIRLDYGIGRASSGFYFQVGEAF